MIIQGDSREKLKEIQSESIDMVITSPPYDNLRSYNNCSWSFNIFKQIAKELTRVIKKGGVIIWIVSDSTIKGSETGTSFKQALYFKDIGLNLHDTMIWEKNCSPYPSGKKSVRYTNIFEYMFILSKGKPKTHNLITDKINKFAGDIISRGNIKNFKNDRESKKIPVKKKTNKLGVRNNIWKIQVGNMEDKIAHKHPAIYPEKLVNDHIITWSNEGDIILDCFAGSGTTLKVSKKLNRNYIGIEINESYINIIKERLSMV